MSNGNGTVQAPQKSRRTFRTRRPDEHPEFKKRKDGGLAGAIRSALGGFGPLNPANFFQTLTSTLLQAGKESPYTKQPFRIGLFANRGLSSERPRFLTEEQRAALRVSPFGLKTQEPRPTTIRVLR